MDKKQIFTTEKGVIDEKNNQLIGVVGSTGTIDRQGESINPMGWILDNFKKNPVIQWAHDYSGLPVGKAIRVYIEDNALKFDIEFAKTAFAKDVFQLFKDKILNAFSVGFLPKKWGTSGQDAYDIMEQELLELSVVAVPANPEALALLKSFEVKHEKELKVEEVKEGEKDKDEEIIEEEIKDDKKDDEDDKKDDENAEEIVEEVKEVEVEEEEEEIEAEEEEEEEEIVEIPEEPIVRGIDEKTLQTLKEITNLFKKADNSVGQGLALIKKLKSALNENIIGSNPMEKGGK